MGQGIYYCCRCQIQLRSKDFEHGAVHFNAQAYCDKCAPKEARILPAPPVPTSSGKNKSTTRIPLPDSSSARRLAVPEESSAGPYLVLAGVLVLGLGALAVVFGSRSDRAPTSPSVPEKPIAAPIPPRPPVVAPTEPSKPPVPGEAALRKARDYVRSNPSDFTGQAELYQDALPLDDARRELDAVLKTARGRVAAELAALDPRTREEVGKEQFSRALDLIEETRRRLNAPEWPAAIHQRAEAVRRQASDLFASIKKEALESRGRGQPDQVKALQDRVGRWGLEPLTADLAKALAEPVAGPEPKPSPEAVAYAASWESALRPARARDYPAALADLKRAADGLKDESIRKKAADDLETLRLAAAALKELLQLPSKWQKGMALSVEFINASGTVERVEGSIARLDAHRVELKRTAGDPVVVPFGEIRTSSLAALLKEADRGLALLGELEGGPEAAREQEARALYSAAEQAYESPPSTADAVQKHATLLKDYGDTLFVRRNRAFIQARSQGGRDFFLFPEDMTAGGSFKWVKSPKTETCFSSDADGEAARTKENFVELSFSVLPGVDYRCWVYAGGCCAETFGFSYQATDLSEPGSAAFLPARITLSSLKKFHSQHTGPKSPSRWEWIALPLPKYSQSGPKKIRILTSQEGFSVAFAFISAARQPPTMAETKILEKARLETPGARALTRTAPPPKPKPAAEDQIVVWKLDLEGGKKPPSVSPGTVEKGPDRAGDSYCLGAFPDVGNTLSRIYVGEANGICTFGGEEVLSFEYWVDSTVVQIVFNVYNRTAQKNHAGQIDKPVQGKWTRYTIRLAELGQPEVLRAGELVAGIYLHAAGGGSPPKFFIDNFQVVRPRPKK